MPVRGRVRTGSLCLSSSSLGGTWRWDLGASLLWGGQPRPGGILLASRGEGGWRAWVRTLRPTGAAPSIALSGGASQVGPSPPRTRGSREVAPLRRARPRPCGRCASDRGGREGAARAAPRAVAPLIGKGRKGAKWMAGPRHAQLCDPPCCRWARPSGSARPVRAPQGARRKFSPKSSVTTNFRPAP